MKKVFLNRKPVSGPWGGGNKTVSLLDEFLSKEEEITLTYDLSEKDIDLIVCIDPKPDQNGVWYQDFLTYREINPQTKILQRVGDLGTHRTKDITELVYRTIHMSDFVIFPSDWARKAIGFQKKNYLVIENQPLNMFYDKLESTDQTKKNLDHKNVKLVTHHWSNNPMKGFETYSRVGKLIQEKATGYENLDFTYIGRWNSNYSSEGITLIDPVDSNKLKQFLSDYDVYLTASELEAGANHVLEALACNLPVLYKSGGGSIDEYCSNYGINYENSDDLNNALIQMKENYSLYQDAIFHRPKASLEDQIQRYIKIIKEIV